MDETLAVPDELREARDEIIRYANDDGGERPNGFEAIKQWFTEDQAVWENLHSDAAAMNFDPAVSTKHGYLYNACDSELRERLADGGTDRVSNAIALCPNCHRELHFGINRSDLLSSVYGRIQRLVAE